MIYIASPFFNPEQLAIVQQIEDVLEAAGVDYFSPRKEGVLKPDASTEERRQVFASNVDNIQSNCTLMIAVTHYALSDKICLAVTENGPVGQPSNILLKLNQPDTGTTFEIGAAYAAGIPLVAFHPAPQDKLNIMLANAFGGFAFSAHQMRQLIWKAEDAYGMIADTYISKVQEARTVLHEVVAACVDGGILSPWEGKVQ
jgi:nucleoside deoxyribosyltransferase